MARARTTAITPELLLQAYSIGLFPMAESATDERLFWVDPEVRGIFPLEGLVVSRSLGKTVRADRFEIRADHDFPAVIAGCAAAAADRPSTWINARIRDLFGALFDQGHAHTVEAYRDGLLVGGLYGLQIGGAFFGESMFHRATDASKICLVHLVARLRAGGFDLLDSQFTTPHLETLGAVEVPRTAYRHRLAQAIERQATFHPFGPGASVPGAEALALCAPRRHL